MKLDRRFARELCGELGIEWDEAAAVPYMEKGRSEMKTSNLTLVVSTLFQLVFIVVMNNCYHNGLENNSDTNLM